MDNLSQIQISQFTVWDWIALSVVLISLVFGAIRGLIKTVFGLAAWVFAVVTPLFLLPMLIPGGVAQLGWPMPVWVINLLAFLVVLITVQLVGSWLAKWSGKAGLGGADRLFGALLGAGRGLLALGFLVVVAAAFGAHRTESWTQSQTRPLLDGLLAKLGPMLNSSTVPSTNAIPKSSRSAVPSSFPSSFPSSGPVFRPDIKTAF